MEKSAFRQYATLFRVRFLAGLQYRAAALAGIATQFAWGGLMVLLYRAFYEADPAAFPMPLQATCSYIWMQQAFLAVFMTWGMDASPIALIRSGDVSYELCRPVDLYWTWFTKECAYRLSKAALRCMPILLIAAFLPAPYGLRIPGLPQLGLFLLSGFLALLNIAALGLLIDISTFFTLDATGVRSLLTAAADFLSGGLVPLAFLPTGFQKVLVLLPFAGMENTPLQLFNGEITGADAAGALLLQLFWAVLMIAGGRIWMEKALGRVIAQGG